MTPHQLVAKTEWIEARRALLSKEKEMMQLRDRLAEEQRALPWVKIEKTYVFEGPHVTEIQTNQRIRGGRNFSRFANLLSGSDRL